MLVSHRYRFIYIKTRKTASTSIEGLLETFCAPDDYAPKHRQPYVEGDWGIIAGRAGGETDDDPLSAHSSAGEIRDYVGPEVFDAYTKVYAVRNPYDKVVSWFWHVMPKDVRAELEGDTDKARWLFRSWLRMRPQLPIDRRYYRTPAGSFEAHVIRYESIGPDIEALGSRLGFAPDIAGLPNWKAERRKNRDMPLAAYYDATTREIVERMFAHDFRAFGYSRGAVAAPAGVP